MSAEPPILISSRLGLIVVQPSPLLESAQLLLKLSHQRTATTLCYITEARKALASSMQAIQCSQKLIVRSDDLIARLWHEESEFSNK